jgi:hypothetical protein
MHIGSRALRRAGATRGVLKLSANSGCSISSLSPIAVSEIESERERNRRINCLDVCMRVFTYVCVCVRARRCVCMHTQVRALSGS